MSSDPLFPCCQSSVAGTSRFGIHSHARRYSDLAIPSSLKLLARAHCGDLAHQRKETKRSWWNASSRTRWKQVESAGNYCIVQELGSVNLPSYPCRHVRASDLWCRRRRDVKVSTFILSLLSILFILISILYILSPNALTCL